MLELTAAVEGLTAAVEGLTARDAPSVRSWKRRWILGLRLSDLAVIAVAVAVAQILRFGSLSDGSLAGVTSVHYAVVSITIAAFWLAALEWYRTRAPHIIGGGHEEYRRVWTASLSLFGAIAVLSTLCRLDIARGYLAIALPLGLVGLTGNRWLWRRFVLRRRRQGAYANAVLAVGRIDAVRALALSVSRAPGDGFRLVGVCAPGVSGAVLSIPPIGDIPVYSYDGDIASAVRASLADTVVLTSGELNPEEIRDLSWQLDKLEVNLVVAPGMVDVAGPRLTLRQVGGQPLLHVDKPQYHGAKRFQKRAFDVCFAVVVLAITLPLTVVAACAVKLTSPGPVFYLSERIGLDGKPFRMIKFRTMVVDADRRLLEIAHLNESGGVLFKIRQDPRVTSAGRWLRRYSIDELPQFINVLRGEMSVIGPRPPLRNEVEAYDSKVRRRLLVPPGITGLWQVSGRSDLSWEDSVRLDLSYVENWSMLNDLAIALKTASVVVRASGAY